MKTMAYKILMGVVPESDLYLVIHGTTSPSREEWERYIADMLQTLSRYGGDVDRLPTLIISDGGAPDAMQRADINEIQARHGKTANVACISASPLIRGVTRALTWFNAKFKVFAPAAFDGALAHLRVPQARASMIKAEILALEREIGFKVQTIRPLFAHRSAPR